MHFWDHPALILEAHSRARTRRAASSRAAAVPARGAGTAAAPCHKAVIPLPLENLTGERDLPSGPWHGSSGSTHQEAQVPTLFRFLLVVAVLAGLGFAAMFALATFVDPDPREITVPVPTQRQPSSS